MKEIFSDMLLLMTVLKFADDKTGADSTYFWTVLSLTRVLMCFSVGESVGVTAIDPGIHVPTACLIWARAHGELVVYCLVGTCELF